MIRIPAATYWSKIASFTSKDLIQLYQKKKELYGAEDYLVSVLTWYYTKCI